MPSPTLTDLLATGDRLLAALEAGDIDLFSRLVEERDGLIRSLPEKPSMNGAELEVIVDALTRQHARLDHAMQEARLALGSALSTFSRFRSARDAYRRPPRPAAGRLNKSLQG